MTRKPLSLIFIVLLVFAMALVGCKRSATPPMEELPPEGGEETAMIQEAEENTEALEATPTIVGGGEEPETSESDAEGSTTEGGETAPEATATVEPTPVPTLELATPVPTVAPTDMPADEPAVATTPGTHVVQAGENLFRIALRYGTTVEEIAQANGITNASLIYVGQELMVSSGTSTPPTTSPSDGEVKHVVQPGENLFRIALRYNYDQYYIARYNGISNPSLIYVGQVIQIPAN